MTTQKTVKVIDYLIQRKLEIREGFIDPQKSWNMGEPNISGISIEIGRFLSDDVEILKLIRSQIVPKCKHSKKMRDKCEGVEYCMNCNSDL